jgi:hypothetical protein
MACPTKDHVHPFVIGHIKVGSDATAPLPCATFDVTFGIPSCLIVSALPLEQLSHLCSSLIAYT